MVEVDANIGIVRILNKNKEISQLNILSIVKDTYLDVLKKDIIKLNKKANKKFGFGVQCGYGLYFIQGKLSPYIGVGIQYNLLKF